jgi:hypothetical protein
VEDLLKWLVFTQTVWNKSAKDLIMPPGELEELKKHCNQLNLYQLLGMALSIDLLDYDLFRRLDGIRVKRNRIIHQYWLYVHRGKLHILRKKLEKIAGAANSLVGKLNDLLADTGIYDDFGFLDIVEGKNVIP